MCLKKLWTQYIEKYMKNTSESINATDFSEDEICRCRIIFKGLVQGVGFRYETWTIAQKLELAGFVKNLPDGSVYAEIEGPKNRIKYLIECLNSISRIQIESMEIDEIALKKELEFEIAD